MFPRQRILCKRPSRLGHLVEDGDPIPDLELGHLGADGVDVACRIVSAVSGDAEFGKFPVLGVGTGVDYLDDELVAVWCPKELKLKMRSSMRGEDVMAYGTATSWISPRNSGFAWT